MHLPPSRADQTGQRRALSVWIPANGSALSTFLRVLGPGYLVAVGYMDPGNWATDLAAGSQFGYSLLWVVGISSLMAMLLQSLCCRLGIASGLDLAEACAKHLPEQMRLPLWVLAELAIVACDLAELVGSAIALQLLVGLPLPWGVALTALDTLLLLLLQRWGVRHLEAIVIALVVLVGSCFAVELVLLQPNWTAVAQGFIPQIDQLRGGQQWFLAAGIVGATVMPHNLYLHSSLVKSRVWEKQPGVRQLALRFSTLDALIALSLAFVVNAAILVLAGGSFYGRFENPISDLGQAYHLLTPVLGTSLASLLFGIALLAAGQSSTITATLAGQVVMEGFLNLRLPDWQRRLLTRGLALIPAMVTVIVLGDMGINKLLVLSQVLLSLQLPFAAIPLVWICSRPEIMGDLVAPRWLQILGWLSAGLIVVINAALLISTGSAAIGH
ncbi:Nramp family divalent metal transporter [Cyanobium sp. WAJ14-Wanaka]|uniref:Nramp family divalent metal transporter n=1 Tax=Cyanobium sp. WAJ14-Wanaka TaxID=2823725 RepID=UPI0020CC3DC4|nr:Nramp family divalent metal transporter [Cyanobium sp. WAJ14-Wanaka]